MVTGTAKGGYRRYRMNERSPRKRKLDERVRNTARRGKLRTPSKDFYGY